MDTVRTEFSDTLEMIQYYGSLVITVISVLVMIGVILLCSRFFIRYLHHKVRTRYLGGMIWHEVIFEGALDESELVKADGQVKNMTQLMSGTISKWLGLFTFNRAMTSFMIRKSPTDDSAHMYIGMDAKNYSDGKIRSWTQGSNCSVEPIDFDEIGFVPKAPTTAVVNTYIPQKFTDQPTNATIGGVVSRLQDLLPEGHSGTALITFEPMRRDETRILISHITEDSMKNTRTIDGSYNRVGDYIEYFRSNSPSRGVIVGFSDQDDVNESEEIVDATINSMNSIGVDRDNRSYANLNRKAGFVSLFPSILLLVLAFFNIIPWWIGGVAITFSLATLLGVKYMSSFWIEQASKDGAAPIPPFWRYSLRRKYREWAVKASPFDFDAGNKQRAEDGKTITMTYTEKPSTPEVFPLYTTSLMQFLSMPLSGRGTTNLSRSVVPQVAMPSSVSKTISNFVASNDATYFGISAKSNEPVYQTPRDLNFGIAVGGDAGSGKTNYLTTKYIESCRLSRKEDGIIGKKKPNGDRVVTINPIWFETKSDDLSAIISAVERFDPKVLYLHDETRPTRLALEGKRYGDPGVTIDDIQRQQGLLVSAMQAIWGSSFMHRSTNIVSNALMIAYLLNEEDLKAMKLSGRIRTPERPNIMELVSYLVGSDPSLDMLEILKERHEYLDSMLNSEQKEKDLRALMQDKGEEELNRLRILSINIGGLIRMYEVREALAPVQSKLPMLRKSSGLFETVTPSGEHREEYSIDELFTYDGPVVVDMTIHNSSLADPENRNFIMMIHYMLWQSIRMKAANWAKQGKFIQIFADEVTNFTGRKEDHAPCATILGEVRDQGRSYGVSHNFGYQNFGQLPDDTRKTVLAFDSNLFFKFNSVEDQNEVINQLSSGRYIVNNIRSLPKGIGIALLTINRKSIDPFTVRTPYFEDWNNALKDNYEDASIAFEVIRDKEIEYMKVEKKKKIDDVVQDDETEEHVDVEDMFSHDSAFPVIDDNEEGVIQNRWS